MSRQAGSIVSGEFKAAPDIRQSGPAAGAAMYCGRSQRSRYREPRLENAFRKHRKWIDQNQGLSWQEWQGSNLRPPVLETGALPIELHSYGMPAVAADPRRFKHRRRPVCKGEA